VDARLDIEPVRATTFTVGVEREWQESQTAFESTSGFGVFSDETDDNRANTGIYAQLHATAIRGLAVTLGARIDDDETFGMFRTGRAAVAWRPLESVRLHGALGTAFKEPTFFENYATGFTRGNPDLEPEQARSHELGVQLTTLDGRMDVGATWFDQRFRNLIQYTFAAPAPDAPNFYNVGAARARGLELSAAAGTGPLQATAAYTFTSTRVTDDGFGEDMSFGEGRRLLRRPRHQATLDASLRAGTSLTLGLGARYVGEREDLDFTDPAQWNGIRTTLDDYAVVDAAVTYGLARGARSVDLSAGVRNLLDRRYQEIYNFPAAGRVFHIGVRAATGL
jgi:vitamin B12 transporter